MRRRLRHSIGTLLLVGWCLLFLRCETTEKSMVRALYLAQNEATVTVGLLYQAPEASADASEASAAMQMRLAEESTLEKALSSVQKKLPQKADYRLCDFLIISENTSEELLSAYETIVLESGQGRAAAKASILAVSTEELEKQLTVEIKDKSWEEEKEGLVKITLESFSEDKIVIRKVYNKSSEQGYILRLKDGEVVIYRKDEKEPVEKNGLKEENLSKQDKKILQGGYAVRTEKELYSVLENFSS